ncbi:hypothetical protein GQ43DRAFT_438636 [Delitschia confertaspora ATCC 74209]|uniref:DUF8021 domain-containing protein n=1 Tax=Delitschia confertaspora ATCC 74209 TaxID=1513339 RepID=A0A9P4JSM6_9PLEO|nr:hypothetical protein GQ43DRAFT_438636 [Delitschia confertaspora ATCC 74209]
MLRSLTSLLAFAGLSASHCTRTLLNDLTGAYIATQSTGNLGTLESFLDNSTWLGYWQNGKKVTFDTHILSTPLNITHNRSTFDTVGCASYTELLVADPKNPYVIGTQLRFANHAINKVESVVTTTGDWLFNVTGYAYWVERENWEEIPAEKRDSRETIKAAADAYCNLFSNPNTTVPWGTPCARLEGGAYTGRGLANDSCAVGVPSGVQLTNRRYVIDEWLGTVDVMLDFGGAGGLPDTHEFRVEGGKIRYVHTMTACLVKNCGFNMTMPALGPRRSRRVRL